MQATFLSIKMSVQTLASTAHCQIPITNPPQSNKPVGQISHLSSVPPDYDNLHAVIMIHMYMGAGYYLLTRLEYGATQADLTLAMVVIGLGLGAVMQTYTLIVQNATAREDLGVATSTTQLSRSMGATLGRRRSTRSR